MKSHKDYKDNDFITEILGLLLVSLTIPNNSRKKRRMMTKAKKLIEKIEVTWPDTCTRRGLRNAVLLLKEELKIR